VLSFVHQANSRNYSDEPKAGISMP
jgi:hypothetical protein